MSDTGEANTDRLTDYGSFKTRLRELVSQFRSQLDEQDESARDGLTLYHYTSPDGLLGILSDGAIHASDANFLNDRLELKYVHELVQQVSADLVLDEPVAQIVRDGLKQTSFSHIGAFVASFSEDPDCLSQWRAYAADGAGYAIGLPGTVQLRARRSESTGTHTLNWDLIDLTGAPVGLSRVIYDPIEQRQLLRDALERLVGPLRTFVSTATEEDATRAARSTSEWIARATMYLAPRLKQPGFREEREWRATVRYVEETYPPFSLLFKPSRHGLTARAQLESCSPDYSRSVNSCSGQSSTRNWQDGQPSICSSRAATTCRCCSQRDQQGARRAL